MRIFLANSEARQIRVRELSIHSIGEFHYGPTPLLYLHNFNGSQGGNWNTSTRDRRGASGSWEALEPWNKDKVANEMLAGIQSRQIWRGKWNVNWDAGRLFSLGVLSPRPAASFPCPLSSLNAKNGHDKEVSFAD